MRTFLGIMISLMLVTGAQAMGPINTLPTDGNGNQPMMAYNPTDSNWVLLRCDTDGRLYVIVSSMPQITLDTHALDSVTFTSASSTWNDSITIRGTDSDGAVPVSGTFYQPIQPVSVSTLSTMKLASCTISASVITIDLGDTYNTVYLFADTVAMASLNFETTPTTMLCDIIADDYLPMVNTAVRYVNVVSYYGTESATKYFRVRAFK